MYPSEIERNGGALLEIIARALALPAGDWPDVPREKKPDPESTGTVELLQAVLKAISSEANIAPTLLATTADLQTLVDLKQDHEKADIPLLRGWRRQLVGETLLQVISGRQSVWINPATNKLEFGTPP